ncbi:FUSC family protein [Kocuria sp.]|uniref:FUSC family protein n=1 Tax=Kocuria sp. TaxID=1871328 RepID=UPI0026DEE45A|nr:FUSC family protein [Kocuria sp.]MDO5617856.1 FUSC family protein [Kocuria sp.]
MAARKRTSERASAFTAPRSWRRRSWILAGVALAPMLLMVLWQFGPDPVDSPWWLAWVLWSAIVLGIALGVRRFMARQTANFDRSDPILKDIKAIDDGLQWTGKIPGLDSTNFEATFTRAAAIYKRLRIQSMSADDLTADLDTTAGWTTPGTDISIRGSQPASPVDGPDNPLETDLVFQISNTTQFARIDGLQTADDLARLVYLLRDLAPKTASTHPCSDKGTAHSEPR